MNGMLVTVILTLLMCAMLFLMVWAAAAFHPCPQIASFMPEDIQEKIKDHRAPFRGAPVVGWIIMILAGLGYIGVIVYGGRDGVARGYTFVDFLIRFLIILLGVKLFDIVGLDYILITKTHFFQHYFPETEGCAGYHQFVFNRKQQIRQCAALPFFALLTAWICSLI